MTNLINYLLISNIFTGGFVLTTKYYDFYIAYIFMSLFLLVFILSKKKITIHRNFIHILLLFLSCSLINVIFCENSIFLLAKSLIGFILNGVTYYLLIRLNGDDVYKLFDVYVQLAFIVALIGIFQEISFLVGFKYGYDFAYFIPRIVIDDTQLGILRVTSIMQEPAHFGAIMAPAVFISILNVIQTKKYFINAGMSCLIILSVLLSFSLVSYLGIAISFILIMLNYRKKKLIALCAITLFIFSFISYKYLPVVRMKVNQTVAVISGKIPLEKTNLSTFSFYSNGIIAFKSFINNPLIGSGIGSHPFSYEKYISQIVSPNTSGIYINSKDANSLFFRIVSETGLLGIFLFFYFLFKFYVSKKELGDFWVISNSILCLFILNLIRQGNYFYGGFIFFMWMYYFTGKKNNDLVNPKI